MLLKIIREPLVHFLLIGAILFSVYAYLNPDAMEGDKRIVVDRDRIYSLSQRFERVWQRKPNERELQGLIEDFVIEEIYYREALAMGIDKDDPVIRRRLRQKMEVYTDDLASTLSPNEDELKQYLQQHPDKFKTENNYTFSQVYISSDRPGEDLEPLLAATKHALSSGEALEGDRTLLPKQFDNADTSTINRIFGQGFASKLDALSLNEWQGPLKSGLGLHFIRMTDREQGSLPALVTVRDQVKREWRFDRAQDIDKTLRDKLLAQYDVIVVPSKAYQ